MTHQTPGRDTAGGLVVRLVFTDRHGHGVQAGGVGEGEVAEVGGPGGSSRAPYLSANMASHVGDDPQAVIANRRRVAALLGVPADQMTFMHPDHGRGVAVIGAAGLAPTGVAPGAEIRSVDALVTSTPGVGLAALAADCVPVLMAATDPAVVAAVHCGWRGLAVDVVGAALAAMATLGASPRGIRAWLGPAICGSCYPVPRERAQQVAEVAPEALGTAPDGQPTLDLRAGLVARLAAAAVASELVGGCTSCSEPFFSHRRDGLTGRQLGAITLVPAVAA